MSWVRLALGLIREAATTDLGQDIIRDLRSNASHSNASEKRRPALTDEKQVAEWRSAVDDRMSIVDRNVEMLVKMLNAQDETFLKIQKRQRVWNLVLAGTILATLVAVTALLVG